MDRNQIVVVAINNHQNILRQHTAIACMAYNIYTLNLDIVRPIRFGFKTGGRNSDGTREVVCRGTTPHYQPRLVAGLRTLNNPFYPGQIRT